jgi:hypothetical protein
MQRGHGFYARQWKIYMGMKYKWKTTTTKSVCLLANHLQVSTVLVEWVLRQRDLAPEIGCEEGICFGNLAENAPSVFAEDSPHKVYVQQQK